MERIGTISKLSLFWADCYRLLRLAMQAGLTMRMWRHRMLYRQHLRGLEDHLLDDLGLTRAEAEREAARPFWQRGWRDD